MGSRRPAKVQRWFRLRDAVEESPKYSVDRRYWFNATRDIKGLLGFGARRG
jgi:hypothetical protein